MGVGLGVGVCVCVGLGLSLSFSVALVLGVGLVVRVGVLGLGKTFANSVAPAVLNTLRDFLGPLAPPLMARPWGSAS